MSLAYLTRRATFSAAHRYWREEWSEARNQHVFGLCANPYGHGHNYALEATVAGEIAGDTGFSVDLGALDAALAAVVRRLDHQHLNHAIDAFGPDGLVPTTENLLAWIWPQLAEGLPAGARLHRLRLREDEDLWVDYFGGGTGSPP